MESKKPLLSLAGVTVHFGKALAVQDVSLEIAEGEIVSLIGSNGAGKSTLLRTISGSKALTSGEVRFVGQRVNGLPAHKVVARGIVHVPEGRSLFQSMTVLENLQTGAYLCRDGGEIRRRLGSVYERFPILRERSGQRAGTLSGGQQQMLAIGRALMAGPKLLLLDEPSLGLSPIMVKEIGKIIGDIHQSGVSVFVVEQNAYLALDITGRGYVMETGKIVREGDSRKLLEDPFVRRAYLGL